MSVKQLFILSKQRRLGKTEQLRSPQKNTAVNAQKTTPQDGNRPGSCALSLFVAALFLVAGVFHRSPKSPDGRLESRAGFKGLLRKGMMLLVVLVAVRLDAVISPESTFLRDAAAISLTVNDGLSILENMVLMGVPVPDALKNALTVLGRQNAGQIAGQAADPAGGKGADPDDPAL